MIPELTKQNIASKVDGVLPVLLARQEQLLAAKGRYCQLLPNYSTVPDKLTPPDRLDTKPSDQEEGWSDLLPDPTVLLGFSAAIDAYQSVHGPGFVLRLEALDTFKVRHVLRINFGPLTHLAHDWRQVGTEIK